MVPEVECCPDQATDMLFAMVVADLLVSDRYMLNLARRGNRIFQAMDRQLGVAPD